MPIAVFINFCIFIWLLTLGSVGQAQDLEQQRQLYLQAKKALDAKNPQPYLDNKAALQGYILTPYLELAELDLRLTRTPASEVAALLEKYADVPASRSLQRRWIAQLAKEQPKDFIQYYPRTNANAELDCIYAGMLLDSDAKQAFAIAARLWNSGKSQPKSCIPVFDAWEASGALTQQLRWQRLLLASEAGNYGLARYIAKSIK